jgi:hypothetical protein
MDCSVGMGCIHCPVTLVHKMTSCLIDIAVCLDVEVGLCICMSLCLPVCLACLLPPSKAFTEEICGN